MGLNRRRSDTTRILKASPLLIGFVVCAYTTWTDDVGRRGCLRRRTRSAPIAATATNPVIPRPTPSPIRTRASSESVLLAGAAGGADELPPTEIGATADPPIEAWKSFRDDDASTADNSASSNDRILSLGSRMA